MSTRGLAQSNSNVSLSSMSQGTVPSTTPRPLGMQSRSISTHSLSRLGVSATPQPSIGVPSPPPAPTSALTMPSHPSSIAPLVPLKKAEAKKTLACLPRVYTNDSTGLAFGVSATLTHSQREYIVKCVDNFFLQVLSYGNAWYGIISALFIDPCCILVNLLCCDFFVAIEDLPSAMLCLKRVQKLLDDVKEKEPLTSIPIPVHADVMQQPASSSTSQRTTTHTISPLSSSNIFGELSPLYPTTVSPTVIISDEVEHTPHYDASFRIIPGSTITEREFHYYYCYLYWLKGDMGQSLNHWSSLSRQWPSDLFAIKRTQLLAFLIGKHTHMMNIMLISPVLNNHMSAFQRWGRRVLFMYTMMKQHQQQHQQQSIVSPISSNSPIAPTANTLYPWHCVVAPILQSYVQNTPVHTSTTTTTPKRTTLHSYTSTQRPRHNRLNPNRPTSSVKHHSMQPDQHSTSTNRTPQPINVRVQYAKTTTTMPSPSSSSSPSPSPLELESPSASSTAPTDSSVHTEQSNPSPSPSPSTSTSTSTSTSMHSAQVFPMQPTLNYSFYNIGAFFGMLSFALEQKHLFLPSLRSGLIGSVISLVMSSLCLEQQQYHLACYSASPSSPSSPSSSLSPIQPQPQTQSQSKPLGDRHPHRLLIQHNWQAYQPYAAIPRDPWSHHSVSHALFSLGAHPLALRFLLSCSPDWGNSMSFLFTHCFFHVGLVYLELGQFIHALAIFDCCLWQFTPTVPFSIHHPASSMEQHVSPSQAPQVLPSHPDASDAGREPHTPLTTLTPSNNHFLSQYSGTALPPLTTAMPSSQQHSHSLKGSQSGSPPHVIYQFPIGRGYLDTEHQHINIVSSSSPPPPSSSPLPLPTIYYSDPSLFLSQYHEFRQLFDHPYYSGHINSGDSDGNGNGDEYDVRSDKHRHPLQHQSPSHNSPYQLETPVFSMFNYHYSLPSWDVYQFLSLLGYSHVNCMSKGKSPPSTPSGFTHPHQQHPSEQPKEGSQSSSSNTGSDMVSYSESIELFPYDLNSHPDPSLAHDMVSSTSSSASTSTSTSTHPTSMVVPLIWKRYDQTYKGNTPDALRKIMPLRNPTNTQDLTNAIGLLWKLEAHTSVERGIIATRVDRGPQPPSTPLSPSLRAITSSQSSRSQYIYCPFAPNNRATPQVDVVINKCQPYPFLAELSPRFESIYQVLVMNQNETHQDLFFDVLIGFIFLRCGQFDRLRYFVEGATAAVVGMPDSDIKRQRLASFVPLIHSFLYFADKQYDKAAELMMPIFIANHDQLTTSPSSSDHNRQSSGLGTAMDVALQVRGESSPSPTSPSSPHSHSAHGTITIPPERDRQSPAPIPTRRSKRYSRSQHRLKQQRQKTPQHATVSTAPESNTAAPDSPAPPQSHPHRHTRVNIATILGKFDPRLTQRVLFRLFKAFDIFFEFLHQYHKQYQSTSDTNSDPKGGEGSSQCHSNLRTLSSVETMYSLFLWLRSKERQLVRSPQHTSLQQGISSSQSSSSSPPLRSQEHHPPHGSTIPFVSVSDELLACIGGSNEQREVFLDYFTLTLLLATSTQQPPSPQPQTRHASGPPTGLSPSPTPPPQPNSHRDSDGRVLTDKYHEVLLHVLNQRLVIRDSPWLHHLKAITLKCLYIHSQQEMRECHRVMDSLHPPYPSDPSMGALSGDLPRPRSGLFISR